MNAHSEHIVCVQLYSIKRESKANNEKRSNAQNQCQVRAEHVRMYSRIQRQPHRVYMLQHSRLARTFTVPRQFHLYIYVSTLFTYLLMGVPGAHDAFDEKVYCEMQMRLNMDRKLTRFMFKHRKCRAICTVIFTAAHWTYIHVSPVHCKYEIYEFEQ